MPKRSNPHTSLVTACVTYINTRGGFAWRNQTGVLPMQGRYIHAGRRGLPDVISIWPPLGRTLCVEVKTGTARLTKEQTRVHAELTKRGALVLVVRSITDLEAALR